MMWRNSHSNRSSYGWLLLVGFAALLLSPSVRSAVCKVLVNGAVGLLKWTEGVRQNMSTGKGIFHTGWSIELGGSGPVDRGQHGEQESVDLGGISAEKVIQFLRKKSENHSFSMDGTNERDEKRTARTGNEGDFDRTR
jgi:hypothetical protein